MSNVNVCMSCGIEVFVGVDAESGILIGYCDCPVVPEVDVFVPEDMPCCSEVNEVFCDVCGDFGPDVCSCSLPVFCVVCNTSECDGKCDSRVEIEDEEFIYVYEEAEVLAAVVGCSSCGQAACQGPNERGYCLEHYDNENLAAPKWVEAAMVLMMIISFFGILYDIATGRNNDPKLVIAWYLFCVYLIVSYSAVIIWFLC